MKGNPLFAFRGVGRDAQCAPQSPVQKLVSAIYGEITEAGEDSARASGLCSRIIVMAERGMALSARELAGEPFDPATRRYADWANRELRTACEATGRINSLTISASATLLQVGRPGEKPAVVAVPARTGAIQQMIETPALWERDAYYIGTPDFFATADEEMQARIAEAIPVDAGDDSEQARYDQGFRDALESVMLAALHEGVSLDMCRNLAGTALDAFANNAPEFARDVAP